VSEDTRDRAAAAELLATSAIRDDAALDDLLDDRSPAVRAAALGALADTRFAAQTGRLEQALVSRDPGVRMAAATASGRHITTGEADPRLVLAVADSLETATGYEMAEARQALEVALGLPPLRANEPLPPTPTGRFLDRLSRDRELARTDPRPRVEVVTERGSMVIELYREDAPIHTASFLELVDARFYDGLDFHRVVPNFVVQGLDPRGDGIGTGGRRLPDEFNPRPFVAGTVGMPHAGPNTGGCQIFITHVPTPHLDGRYTVFGQVVDGLDVIDRLEAGDTVLQVRRVDG
jgi:cyclophilin family peptidyl-prolyl cis-trans isomerase